MREKIREYLEENLYGFKLESVEITDDDVSWVKNKINKDNVSLEDACDECLQGIRDCLDEGLGKFPSSR